MWSADDVLGPALCLPLQIRAEGTARAMSALVWEWGATHKECVWTWEWDAPCACGSREDSEGGAILALSLGQTLEIQVWSR